MKNKNIKKNLGFTLVELIIVMAGFLLIVAVAVVIFISIIQSQRKILLQNQLLNQSSYLIEYMSKGLRMARNDGAGSCLTYVDEGGELAPHPGCNYLYTKSFLDNYYGIKFINENNTSCQEFYFDTEDGRIKELKDSIEEIDATPLISEKFNVKYFNISINGLPGLVSEGVQASCIDSDYPQQPRVTTTMGFGINGDDSQSDLKIQTTVSQRNLNE